MLISYYQQQSIGMTTQCPDNISIPRYALEWSDHSDYWILDCNTLYHNDEKRELIVNLESLRGGQTVGSMISRDGELHVYTYIDGVDDGIVWPGHGLPTNHSGAWLMFMDAPTRYN